MYTSENNDKRTERGRSRDFCCDPNQMHGLNPEGHTVTAERLCLVSLASRPQVNFGKPDP